MKRLWKKIKSWFGENGNDSMIKEEKMSYEKYKKLIKNKKIDNLQEVKVIPPSLFSSNERKVKVVYKRAKNKKKDKTKRVVHDQRQIKMKNPDLNRNGKSG